jgi:hypothetical protein
VVGILVFRGLDWRLSNRDVIRGMPVEDLGEQQLKNIARPARVYRVATDRNAETATGPLPLPLPNKPSITAMGYSRSGSRNRLSGGSASDGRSRGSKRNRVPQ